MYLSVFGENTAEQIIERSRFIAYVSHIEGEEEAKAFLARVRAEHPLATHVCYGYIADGLGNEQRFSDAGEPQGTAGMPILGVLKAQGLFQTAVAVVRYFGGIKLGAGGLTRAYSSSAALGISAAKICEHDVCVPLRIKVGYPSVNAIMQFLEREGYSDYGKSFGEEAEFEVAVREKDCTAFCDSIRDRLNGRVVISEGERYIHPFQINK
ncbi:MAG: IMPACT family protein [Clostridia bacterium]|nr:IMPACT family protein [Clostridia bacterium]